MLSRSPVDGGIPYHDVCCIVWERRKFRLTCQKTRGARALLFERGMEQRYIGIAYSEQTEHTVESKHADGYPDVDMHLGGSMDVDE